MSSVDVIVPCYNYARFLPQCIGSVQGQDGVDLRVLIIDDASSDDTPEVGRELARHDRRVEYRRHTSNRGHIATYNEGLEWAAADYVLVLSADDGLTPGALSRAARLMDIHRDIGLTYGRQITFDSTWPDVVPVVETCSWRVHAGAAFLEMASASAQNPVPTPTAIVRTSLQKAVGGYRKELPHTADLEMWLRLAARGPVGVLDTVQAVKRWHDRNMHLQYVETALADLSERHAAFDAFFHAHRELVGADRLRTMAFRGLAHDAFWAASHAVDRCEVSACERLLAFATQLDPDLESRPEWSRLKWKRRGGSLTRLAIRGVQTAQKILMLGASR
jgi:glycosyltransferase involved in cell wall biosynthesis